MKILIACDSFKDALPAMDVCRAIAMGFINTKRGFETHLFPLADGGEGTAEILTFHNQGKMINKYAAGPLFKRVKAGYGLSKDGQTSFLDMAQASGLQLVLNKDRNPLKTTTYGTGELIMDCIKKGVQKIILGIGGSATNDAGMGMATALGFVFRDKNGKSLKGTGENLIKVVDIEVPELQMPHVEVLCDVKNPLYGEEGAAYVYGPQKGGTPKRVVKLDEGLRHFAEVCKKHFGVDHSKTEGAGAAGGLGFGGLLFLNATLRSGIEAVMAHSNFEEKLSGINYIITGEGKIDHQTAQGKLIQGICQMANKHHIPVIGVCGTLSATQWEIQDMGLQAAFSVLNRPTTLKDALRTTAQNLEDLAFNLGRLLDKH